MMSFYISRCVCSHATCHIEILQAAKGIKTSQENSFEGSIEVYTFKSPGVFGVFNRLVPVDTMTTCCCVLGCMRESR